MAALSALVAYGQSGGSESLNVVGATPLEGEPLGDQIVIFFDKGLQPLAPGPDGRPQAPLTFQPALPGDVRFGANFLVYRISFLDRSQQHVFDMAVNPALKSKDGKSLNPQQPHLTFATFALDLQGVAIERGSPESTTAALFFSTALNLDVLKAHLRIVAPTGEPIPFALQPGTNPAAYRVTVQGVAPRKSVICLEPGLTDADGRLRLAVLRTYYFPQVEPLKVVEVKWGRYSDNVKRVRIQLSRPVQMEDLKQHLSVADAATNAPILFDLTPVADANSAVVTLRAPLTAGTGVAISIAEGLSASDGGKLASTVTTTLPSPLQPLRPPGASPGFQITSAYWRDEWNQDSRDGMRLDVNVSAPVNIAEVKNHIEITPPLDGMRLEPDGGGFLIYGNWSSKQQYEIKLTPGLKDNEGTVLNQPVVRKVKSPRIPSYLGFSHPNEYYFPRRTGLSLPIETRNVDKIEVQLSRMFPSNIMVALNDMRQGRGSPWFDSKWGEEIASKEIPVNNVRDRLTETPLDLDALFPQDKKGVFCLTASQTDEEEAKQARTPMYEGDEEDYEYYPHSNAAERTKMVIWTNIGVLAHWQESELAVFVHDLFSLAPLSAAKISVYSTKNQLLGTADTDAAGMARFTSLNTALGEPRVLVAEREGDFTFLDLVPRNEDGVPDADAADRSELSGASIPYDRKGYDAFIYADRDLYRPGETVHAHWTVRTNYGDALANVPLVATVLRPNGRNLLSQPVTLSPLGSGGLDITTQKSYPTGKYTIELSVPASKETIGTYPFSLEEFVPNRIKSTVKLDQTQWLAGQTYPIHVNAQHLFGAPAAGRKVEATVILKRAAFAPETWKGYKFENDSDFIPESVPCGEAATDDAGNAEFTFDYQPPNKLTCPLKAIVVGRVFELGGRAVGGKAESTFFPSDTALGIRTAPAADGSGTEVFAAAITPDEKPAALAKVSITLEKQVWNYYVRRYYNYHESNWSESFEAVETREVPLIEGKGSTVFTPKDWGYYRVRVHSDATPQYSTISFYAYGGRCQIVDSARPSLLKIALDKTAYQPGEEAQIRIESPFDGKGIIVIQGDEIQDMIPVEIKDKVGVIRYPVTKKQFPNVWIEATVIHAIQGDRKQLYPFSSFAMTCLNVRDPQRLLNVAYPGLPQEIRPAAEAKFDVLVTDAAGAPAEAEITLAAVDEGIHGITDYKSPDPYAWLCRDRRPDFRRAHYYDKVAYDFDKPAIGGDSLLKDLDKRLPSVDENWIKPVALWSGVVRTDAAGHATVTMAVPEFTGQLRLAAVACTPAALGGASANLYVRRPYMLRTSLPRFLLPGDAIHVRGVFFNNSDAPCKARVSWSSSGAVRAGGGSKDLEAAPHAETAFEAEFAAANTIGQGTITWDAVVLDGNNQELMKLQEVDPIPVRAPAAYQAAHEVIIMNPGETRELRNTKFLEDERTAIELTVGASPLLRLDEALRYTVHYPYGCVEQTTSSLMPMYLLRKSAALVESALVEPSELESYLHAGIERLFAMMTASGGLSTWPGDTQPYPYGSVYALHFLTLVKTGREIELPAQGFKALQDYVRGLAFDSAGDASSDLHQRAYALYVLALDGDAEAIRQIQRFDTIKIPRSARYLLAAAIARNTQDKDRVKAYLAAAPSEPWADCLYHGVLNSPIRNDALELMALHQMGAPAEEMQQKANALVQFLEQHHYGNTQETAFIVTALATYLSDLNAGAQNAAATITSSGKQESLAGPNVYRGKHAGPGGSFTVANTGACPLFINLVTRGVPEKNEVAAAAQGGLSISRNFRTNHGDAYTQTTFQQGASYVVDLGLTCDSDLKNVVVADLLPAGFEIENPRLDPNTLPGGAFVDGVITNKDDPRMKHRPDPSERAAPLARASYLEVRDDRAIVAFNELAKGSHHIYYVVRAVTPGTYQQPPVEAECMYNAAVRANTAATAIEVK